MQLYVTQNVMKEGLWIENIKTDRCKVSISDGELINFCYINGKTICDLSSKISDLHTYTSG